MKYVILALLVTGCLKEAETYYETYPSDNFIEELAEDGIKAYSGWDLDLSPFSPE